MKSVPNTTVFSLQKNTVRFKVLGPKEGYPPPFSPCLANIKIQNAFLHEGFANSLSKKKNYLCEIYVLSNVITYD